MLADAPRVYQRLVFIRRPPGEGRLRRRQIGSTNVEFWPISAQRLAQWLRRFHVGTGQHDPTSDAGYTTASNTRSAIQNRPTLLLAGGVHIR